MLSSRLNLTATIPKNRNFSRELLRIFHAKFQKQNLELSLCRHLRKPKAKHSRDVAEPKLGSEWKNAQVQVPNGSRGSVVPAEFVSIMFCDVF